MSDDLGIDIGDLPLPAAEAPASSIADKFDYNVAFKFAFVGVGQCGGRIAQTFKDLGYDRVCAVNTTIADLSELKSLPESHKLDIGSARGAGKDPAAAAALAVGKDEDFFDLFKRSWGDEVDYAFVCLSAAGGTGAGLYPAVVAAAKHYMATTKRIVRVGAIISLPKDAEGQQFAKNALATMRKLGSLDLSPVIFIDNQKVMQLYNPKQAEEKPLCNKTTAQLFHTFNRLAGTNSTGTSDVTFDRADFAKLLDGGTVAFGACAVGSSDITAPIRDQLKKNMLGSVDLSQSKLAGLLYVLNGPMYDEIRAGELDLGTAMLTRMLASGSTVYPGIYRGKADAPGSIQALVMVSSLPWPADRLYDLAKAAGVGRDEVATLLGV